MNTLKRKLILWRAVRRQRREFNRAYRNYRRHVHPMAAPSRVIDSWWFLAPFGVAVLALYVSAAMGWLA